MARVVMSLWPLVGIGLAGLAALSLVVGLSVSAILGQISREITDLLDSEPWPAESTVATIPLLKAARMGSHGTRSKPAA
jgi:hypothetical protein